MKIFVLSLLLFFTVPVQAQSPLAPVMKSYFRTQPFDTRFSSFIASLQEDPWFTTEIFERRTDTSFFYVSGIYKNFNPFQFAAKEVRLIIAEDQFIHNDSLHTLDTIINLQLMGITDTMLLREQLVKKEYTRFQKKYSSKFWKSSYDKSEKNNIVNWELSNYFISPFSISPITVAWGRIDVSREYVFTITIRFKIKENMVYFIQSPEGL